jgi:hypothetical protein
MVSRKVAKIHCRHSYVSRDGERLRRGMGIESDASESKIEKDKEILLD